MIKEYVNSEGLKVLDSFVDPDGDGLDEPSANYVGRTGNKLLGKDYECKEMKKKGQKCWRSREEVVNSIFDYSYLKIIL